MEYGTGHDMLPTGTWLPVYSDPCCFCSAVLFSAWAAMHALTPVNKARLFRLGRLVGRTPWFGKRLIGLHLFAENFMHEISGVPGAELFQQIGSMEIDRTRADAECPCGLL